MWPTWRTKQGLAKTSPTSSVVSDVAPPPPPKCASCGKTESVVYWRRVSDVKASGVQLDVDEIDDAVDSEDRIICNECNAAASRLAFANNSNGNELLDANPGTSNNHDTLPGERLRKCKRSATAAAAAASTSFAAKVSTLSANNVRQRPSTSASSSSSSSTTAAAAAAASTLPGSTQTQTTVKCIPSKAKSRRTIMFKKSATKSPAAVATVVTTGSLFHKGTYYQVGDVVSMIDVKGGVYYAQIRGLLQDQYCEKSAVITWLIPTENSPDPNSCFDPGTYIIGPEEDVPRRLDCMEFVCHAPSEYFKAKTNPYETVPQTNKPELGFIWTRLKPQIVQMKEKRDGLFECGS